MDRGAWQATVHGAAGVGHDLATKPPPPPALSPVPSGQVYAALKFASLRCSASSLPFVLGLGLGPQGCGWGRAGHSYLHRYALQLFLRTYCPQFCARSLWQKAISSRLPAD